MKENSRKNIYRSLKSHDTRASSQNIKVASMIRTDHQNAHPNATRSTFEWYYIERLAIIQDDFINVILMLAITFTGLYTGSTLKKTTKN